MNSEGEGAAREGKPLGPFRAAPEFPPPRESLWPTLVWLGLAVVALGTVVFFATEGWKRQRAEDRSREARETLGRMARGAVASYERNGALCDSAGPVPAEVPAGRATRTTAEDWRDFECLGFSMTTAVHYQFSYARTEQGFVVTARGDQDGDGVFSMMTYEGRLTPHGTVSLSAQVQIVDEFE